MAKRVIGYIAVCVLAIATALLIFVTPFMLFGAVVASLEAGDDGVGLWHCSSKKDDPKIQKDCDIDIWIGMQEPPNITYFDLEVVRFGGLPLCLVYSQDKRRIAQRQGDVLHGHEVANGVVPNEERGPDRLDPRRRTILDTEKEDALSQIA
jgi:hypothetical protein